MNRFDIADLGLLIVLAFIQGTYMYGGSLKTAAGFTLGYVVTHFIIKFGSRIR